MSVLGRYRPSRLRAFVLAAVAVCGCGSPDSESLRPPRFAVLSAFPAELAPHLERAIISNVVLLDDRAFREGTLEGVPVVLALTGIGLVNAATTTRSLLDRFDVQGVVVSAVAGSTSRLQIGDVAVPAAWAAKDSTTYPAHPEWLDLAEGIAASGTVSLDICTTVPSATDNPVCLLHEPAIVVGGVGESSDPFAWMPFPCWPNGGDVFGCDVEFVAAPAARGFRLPKGTLASADAEAPNVVDMETAAIAREAGGRGVPFIAFRAISDGPGDPLGLPWWVAQFFAYYRLAACNAAAATIAFLEQVQAGTPVQAPDAAGCE